MVRCAVLIRSAFASSARVLSASDNEMCPHLLATKFVEQIPALVAEDFVRDRLDLETAVGVQRQKRASIEIDGIDRPSVRGEKNGRILQASFDCVAIRALGQSRNRDESTTREIRLNQVGAVLWRSGYAAKRKSQSLSKR